MIEMMQGDVWFLRTPSDPREPLTGFDVEIIGQLTHPSHAKSGVYIRAEFHGPEVDDAAAVAQSLRAVADFIDKAAKGSKS